MVGTCHVSVHTFCTVVKWRKCDGVEGELAWTHITKTPTV